MTVWLRCFGSPALLTRPVDGAETVLLPTGKPLLVLAILATRFPAKVSRDELAVLGWGHHDEQHAKGSLRQALHRLRRTLGSEAITTDDHSARLVTNIASDWAALSASVAAGDDLAVVQGLTGGFLDGIEQGDGEEPSEWINAERMRWTLLLRAAALREGRRALLRGDTKAALRCAERTLTIRDERLAGWELYLDALQATDSPSRLEAGLARLEAAGRHGQLAVSDPAHWNRLIQRHRHALDALRLESNGDALPTIIGVLPFTGRAALLEHLLTLLTQPADWPQRPLALIAGPGFGKSRMLAEVRTRLVARGVTLARVEAFATETSSPWALLNRVVERVVTLPGAVGIDPRAAAHLVALNPQLRERFPGVTIAAVAMLPSEDELIAALAELLGAVGESRPLVLLIDDLHWGDERSVAVMHGALLRPDSGNVRSLAATRDNAPKSFRDYHSIHLPSLTVEALESLIAISLPAIAATQRTAAANAMLLVTGGVPHYVARAVQRLVALEPPGPDQADDLGSRMLAAIPSLELYRDPALPDAGDGRNILEYLALVDEPVSVEELLDVLGEREPGALNETLGTLQRQGSIAVGDSGVRLSHDLVLQQIIEEMPEGRQRLLSLQRARRLVEHGLALHELQRAVRIFLAYELTFQAVAAVRTWCRRWPGTARGSALADLLLPPRYTRRLRWQLIAAATPAALWRLSLTIVVLAMIVAAGADWFQSPEALRSENTPRVQPTEPGLTIIRNMEPPVFTVRDRLGQISTQLDGESLHVVGKSASVDSLHLNPLPVVRHGRVSADSLAVFTHGGNELQLTFQVGDLPAQALTVFRGYADQSLAIAGGLINGHVIDSIRPEVTVNPGDSLHGSVIFLYTTPAQAALWLMAESSTMATLATDTATVMTMHTGAVRAIGEVRIARRAPLKPGRYWLVWTFAAEPSAAWILSLTNWKCGTPHWNDQNDLLAVPDSVLEHAWGSGIIEARREICDDPKHPVWQPMHYPTATLRVTVR